MSNRQSKKCQVFTVYDIRYVNGVVYFAASAGGTDIPTLAKHSAETTKSGDVKHPEARVRTLVRLAEGIGLLTRSGNAVRVTEFGRRFYAARASGLWEFSDAQKAMLRDHITADPERTPTIRSISRMLTLVRQGLTGDELRIAYGKAIGKEEAWQSEVTSKGFTRFALNYIGELGFVDVPTSEPGFYLLTWNPARWHWEDLPQAVIDANSEGRYLSRWSCGNTRFIAPGDRVFLMRLGVQPKGIMGSGVVVSEPIDAPHWDDSKAEAGETAKYVEVVFDVLADTPILSENFLSDRLPEGRWHPQNSGTRIPPPVAKRLATIWSEKTGTVFTPIASKDISTIRTEGTPKSRMVVTYERNPQAREECLRHHGRACKVCQIDFGEQYGDIGMGFIHVHHVVPVSDIGHEYHIDPVNDLIPVCPNCHAMLHKQSPPFTVEQLVEIIARHRGK